MFFLKTWRKKKNHQGSADRVITLVKLSVYYTPFSSIIKSKYTHLYKCTKDRVQAPPRTLIVRLLLCREMRPPKSIWYYFSTSCLLIPREVTFHIPSASFQRLLPFLPAAHTVPQPDSRMMVNIHDESWVWVRQHCVQKAHHDHVDLTAEAQMTCIIV